MRDYLQNYTMKRLFVLLEVIPVMSVGIAIPVYACRKVLLEMMFLSKTPPTNWTFRPASLGWIAVPLFSYPGGFPGLKL